MNLVPPPSVRPPLGLKRNVLQPGFSLHDWIKLTESSVDLAGTGGKLLTVNAQELAKHNRPDDLWVALHGSVYNLTPYVAFHPGGPDILLNAGGTDCTFDFDKVHPWVNFKSLLQKCLVGKFVGDMKPLKSNIPNDMKDFSFDELKFSSYEHERRLFIDLFYGKEDIYYCNTLIDITADAELVIWLYTASTHGFKIGLDEPLDKSSLSVEKTGFGKVRFSFESVNTPVSKILRNVSTFKPSFTSAEMFWKSSLLSRVSVTDKSALYTIKFPKGLYLSSRCGFCNSLKISHGGNSHIDIVRSYTPVKHVSLNHDEQHFTTAIKYIIKHYETGEMTTRLRQLDIGDSIYVSAFTCQLNMAKFNKFDTVLLLAAGSGLTPMIDIIDHALSHDAIVILLYFNNSESDIIYYDEMKELAKEKNRFRVRHFLSKPSPNWKGRRGVISKALLDGCFLYNKHTLRNSFIVICGPANFIKSALRCLADLKVPAENIQQLS